MVGNWLGEFLLQVLWMNLLDSLDVGLENLNVWMLV